MVSALEVIEFCLGIVVITAIAERVDGGDITAGRVLFDRRHTPCIVRVSCYRYAVCIRNSDYIALQVLGEVVGNRVVENPANAGLVIIERNKRVFSPSFAENLGSVKDVIVNLGCCLLPSTFLLYHTFPVLSRKTPHLKKKCGEKIYNFIAYIFTE